MLLKDWIDIFVESRSTPRRRCLKSQAEEDRNNNRKTNPDSSPEHEKLNCRREQVSTGCDSGWVFHRLLTTVEGTDMHCDLSWTGALRILSTR